MNIKIIIFHPTSKWWFQHVSTASNSAQLHQPTGGHSLREPRRKNLLALDPMSTHRCQSLALMKTADSHPNRSEM